MLDGHSGTSIAPEKCSKGSEKGEKTHICCSQESNPGRQRGSSLYLPLYHGSQIIIKQKWCLYVILVAAKNWPQQPLLYICWRSICGLYTINILCLYLLRFGQSILVCPRRFKDSKSLRSFGQEWLRFGQTVRNLAKNVWSSAEPFGRTFGQIGRTGSVRPNHVFCWSVVH